MQAEQTKLPRPFAVNSTNSNNRAFSTLAVISLIFALTTLLSGTISTSYADSTITLNDKIDAYSLGLNMDYLEDSSRALTISDITSAAYRDKFIPHLKESPSFGFTESAFWYRTTIINPGSTPRTIILEESPT